MLSSNKLTKRKNQTVPKYRSSIKWMDFGTGLSTGLEKAVISPRLVTLLHICGVIQTPQSPISPITPRDRRRRRAESRRLRIERRPPLGLFFQEQSYSSLHSGLSLAWDHVRGDIDDPCGAIADFCGVIADPCGVVAIGGRRCGDNKTLFNIVKHYKTHVKHCEAL